MTIKELRDRRQKLALDMRTMNETAEKEKRSFTVDEQASWDKMDEEISGLDNQLKRAARMAEIGASLPSDVRSVKSANSDDGSEDPSGVDEKKVFRAYLTGNHRSLNDAEHKRLASMLLTNERESRDFAAGASNVGGATVPQGFYDKLEVAMKAYGGMMETAEIIRTDSGALIPMPTLNSTASKATIIGEGAAITTDAQTPFGAVNLNAYMYAPPVLPVSLQLLQDTAFDESFIINMQAEALARGINEHCTTGTGTGQPQGIVTAAVSGKVGTTGQTTSVIYDDIVDLFHSVDPAYRLDGKFMLHDTSLRNIRKLKDTAGRPIWLPGYDAGIAAAQPDTILGKEYVINQDMPVMAANAKSIIFGKLDKYKIRLVRQVQVLRLVERYADKLQVGFITFQRADGRLLDAGTNPVKFYQNSAT